MKKINCLIVLLCLPALIFLFSIDSLASKKIFAKSSNHKKIYRKKRKSAQVNMTLTPRTSPNISTAKTIKKEDKKMNLVATLETSKGTIEFELLAEDAPKTTENFKLLADKGYYNGVIFHRVIKGFMIQGGDPDGTGTGGESAFGKEFEDEINASSPLYKTGYQPGIVAMANRGPNTNGSQFFIVHKTAPLPPSYTIFGRVTKGQEVVDAIANIQTGPNDKPITPVIINSAKVE